MSHGYVPTCGPTRNPCPKAFLQKVPPSCAGNALTVRSHVTGQVQEPSIEHRGGQAVESPSIEVLLVVPGVFELGEDERGFGDGADSSGGEGDVVEGFPAGGE